MLWNGLTPYHVFSTVKGISFKGFLCLTPTKAALPSGGYFAPSNNLPLRKGDKQVDKFDFQVLSTFTLFKL